MRKKSRAAVSETFDERALPARPFSPVLARDTDTETSQDAADSVLADGTVETHERRILAVLYDWRPEGGTASEVAEEVRRRWGIAREVAFCAHTVCRRWAGLLNAGLVHRRPDPQRPGRWLQRSGEIIHYYGPGDEPLFWQLSPGRLVAAKEVEHGRSAHGKG